MQHMLKLFRRRFAALLAQRNKEANNHASQRRVYAGLQYRRPQHNANQNIEPGTAYAAQV